MSLRSLNLRKIDRRPCTARTVMESLEQRRLLAASFPTAFEQYILELINRARANPADEADRYGIALNEGLSPGTLSAEPKQPLAFDTSLVNSARGHSQDMINRDYFSHTGKGNTRPEDRMRLAGYGTDLLTGSGTGENLGYTASTPEEPEMPGALDEIHRNLFVDERIPGRGHRVVMLNPSYKEVGTGIAEGVFTTGGRDYNAVMVTQDFGFNHASPILTGVVYGDTVQEDDFYTPGEGRGGVTITAKRDSDGETFTGTTFSSGGYSLVVEPGVYDVTALGGGLRTPLRANDVEVASENVKVDFVTTATINNGGGGVKLDFLPPTGRLVVSPVLTGGKKFQNITIQYTDADRVAIDSIGTGDITIVGPRGFRQQAKLASLTPSDDSKVIKAVYRFTPPGGKWNAPDNGIYSVVMGRSQVADISGNFIESGKLGSLTVRIRSTPTGQQPAASLKPLLDETFLDDPGTPIVLAEDPSDAIITTLDSVIGDSRPWPFVLTADVLAL